MIKKTQDISPIAKKILGMEGKKISQSKTLGPATAIWNAQIVDASHTVVWFGDIDIERYREQLLELANQIGRLYIAGEFAESGDESLVLIDQGKIWIDDRFAQYIHLKSMRGTLKKMGLKK